MTIARHWTAYVSAVFGAVTVPPARVVQTHARAHSRARARAQEHCDKRGTQMGRLCIADASYAPTLLAVYNLSAVASWGASAASPVTYSDFPLNAWHPRALLPGFPPSRLADMRADIAPDHEPCATPHSAAVHSLPLTCACHDADADSGHVLPGRFGACDLVVFEAKSKGRSVRQRV